MATTTQILQFYTSPEQIQRLANLGHNVPGYIICGIAILFLFAELGYRRTFLATIYSSIFIAMPVSFIGYIFISNGLPNSTTLARIVAQYPEVYLHILTLIGNLIGGVGEILYVRGRLRHPLGAFCLPILFLMDGYLSILHPHGVGGHHNLFHSLYGSLMVLVGMLIIVERLIAPEFRRYAIVLAAFTMILPAMMLVSFKEPANAYSYAFPSSATSTNPIFIPDTDNVIVYISDENGAVPHNIQIQKGSTVTFIQIDDSVHEIESGPHPQHNKYPPLNVGVLRNGEERKVLFTLIGYFGYHDHINEDDARFQGSVTVTE